MTVSVTVLSPIPNLTATSAKLSLPISVMRPNPKIATSTKKEAAKKPRGDVDYRTSPDKKLIAVRWVDNAPVCALSNHAGIDPMKKVCEKRIGTL